MPKIWPNNFKKWRKKLPKKGGWYLEEWLERLKANANVATDLGSIPASCQTVESEGRHMKPF